MMLIGITGTIGAGKGVVVDYLKKQGFAHYSVRSYLTLLLQEKGLEVTRPHMIALANQLRHDYGGEYIVNELVKQALSQGGRAIVESIRAPKEVVFLQQSGGILIGVTADQLVRYERVVQRGSSLDHITFEQFIHDEQVESTSNDPSDSNVMICLQHCDHIFHNDSTIEELYIQLDAYTATLNL